MWERAATGMRHRRYCWQPPRPTSTAPVVPDGCTLRIGDGPDVEGMPAATADPAARTIVLIIEPARRRVNTARENVRETGKYTGSTPMPSGSAAACRAETVGGVDQGSPSHVSIGPTPRSDSFRPILSIGQKCRLRCRLDLGRGQWCHDAHEDGPKCHCRSGDGCGWPPWCSDR